MNKNSGSSQWFSGKISNMAGSLFDEQGLKLSIDCLETKETLEEIMKTTNLQNFQIFRSCLKIEKQKPVAFINGFANEVSFLLVLVNFL